MGVCCRIKLCCPDDAAAAELAAHEGIATEAAAKVLAGYQLVPLAISVGRGLTDSDRVNLAHKRLVRLHERIKTELLAILIDLGHDEEEGPNASPSR